MKRFASPAKLVGLGAIAALLIAALFGQHLMLGIAVASSEDRPALLRDADWEEPSALFQARFAAGTAEAELLQWLSENRFVLNGANRARRRIASLPCNEVVEISWTSFGGVVRESRAVVHEAACL